MKTIRLLTQSSLAQINYTGTKITNLGDFISNNILPVVYKIGGISLVLLIIYAGFLWLTSAGDDNKIAKAQKVLVAAVIGFLIMAFAFVIEKIIKDALT